MIAILLNDASFEQDIRELLMAFYPGETFTHKEEEAGEAELIVRGVRDGNSFSLDVTPVRKEAVHFALIYPDFSNRFETKNEIKQTLYRLLSAQTDKELKEQTWLRETEDFAEGVRSVNERRPGNFVGR